MHSIRQLGALPAGRILFDTGTIDEGIFLALPEGRQRVMPVFVRIELLSAEVGRPVRFERIGAGEFFGETEWLLAGLSSDYVRRSAAARHRETRGQLMTAGEVVLLTHEALLPVVEGSSLLRQRLVRLGSMRLRNALTTESRRRHLDGDAILAEYLLDLAEDHRRIQGNYASFMHKVSQEEMATDLGIGRRALSDRLRAWTDAGLVRTAPLEILDIRRLRQLEQLGKIPAPRHVARASKEIAALLGAGDLAAARAMALDLIKHFPTSPDLLHAAALASARAGRGEEAEIALAAGRLDTCDIDELFRRVRLGSLRPTSVPAEKSPTETALLDLVETLLPDGEEDEEGFRPIDERPAWHLTSEILALRARLAKDQATASGSEAVASQSAQLYHAAAEAGAGTYAKVNAAVMQRMAGETEAADQSAREIAASLKNASDYWSLSSRMEAQLLLGDGSSALATAKAAMAAPRSDAMVATTRRQLRLLSSIYPASTEPVLNILKVKRPFVFTGPLIRNQFDAPPDEVEKSVREKIAGLLDADTYCAAFGALAQGTDILFAEAALERDMEVHTVLPCGIDEFIDASVGEDWLPRFNKVIAASTSVTIVQPGRLQQRNLDIAIKHGFRCAAAQALERAADLETEALLLAINALGPSGKLAGASAATLDWESHGGQSRVGVLPFTKRKTAGPERLAHGYRHVLFYFPEDKVDPSVEAALRQAAPGQVVDRMLKDRRQGLAAVMDGAEAAARIAVAALEAGAKGRFVCSYGPVMNRSDQIDTELLAALVGATDFPGFPSRSVLAALPFAREVQFSRKVELSVFCLAQRSERPTGQGRNRGAPVNGVYEVILRVPRKGVRLPMA